MAVGLSKAMLTSYLDAVVSYSARLDPLQARADLRVLRKSIAREVWGKKRSAAKDLSVRESTSPIGRARRPPPPLKAEEVALILGASRALLWAQFSKVHPRVGTPDPAAFEAAFCRNHGLPSSSLSADHFDLTGLLMSASTTSQFGFPDLLIWTSEDCGFDPRSLCPRAVEFLTHVRAAIQLEPSDARRLDLLYVAVSAASLFHPGDSQHEAVTMLAHGAADAAGLGQLARHGDDAIRRRAAHIDGQLEWLAFLPHLSSPTNYVRSLLGGRPLAGQIWDRVTLPLERAITAAKSQLKIDPSDRDAVRNLVSATSMRARLLLAADPNANATLADAAFRESQEYVDQIGLPYGYLYPVLRSAVHSKWRTAAAQCESAIERCRSARDLRSARAFGALLFHISALSADGAPSSDPELVESAEWCVRSDSMRFAYSHVFDAMAVRKLLSKARQRSRGHAS